jgi:glycosyltransferase involved in cell wall biosynthesis
MARAATAVIADSEFIASRCRLYNRHTAWIPDNVPMEEVPAYRPTPAGKRLRLLWSGEAVKLFELLAAEDALLALRDRLELVLVTGDLAATSRLYPEVRDRLERLLSSLSVDVVRFESIARLFEIYAAGGVCISPRFLDNPYNFGHTEWKISLAMACGRIAVCSPVPSYVAVAERAQDRGIRICDSHEEWLTAFDELLGGHCRWDEEESAARTVVDRFYSTRAVAANHMAFVRGVLDENAAGQGARLKAG